jgi:O-antigen/teichoic acid export membrane protein
VEVTDIARSRRRAVASAGLAALVGKVLALVAGLVSVRVAVATLGSDRFGLVAAVVGLSALLALSDVGLGNALVREVARARAADDDGALARIVSSGIGPLLVLAVPVGIAVLALARTADLGGLLQASEANVRDTDVDAVISVVMVAALATIVLGAAGRVRTGLQQAHISGWCQAVGYSTQLLLALWAGQRDASLVVFAAILCSGPVLGHALDAALLVRRHPWSRPALRAVDATTARRLFGAGGWFFVLALGSVVAIQADAVIVANALGPDAAATTTVTFQVVLLGPAAIALFLHPLWGAYGDAEARGDHGWIRRTFHQTLVVALGASAAWALVVVAAGGAVIDRWTDGAVTPPPSLLAASAAWVLVAALTAPLSAVLNGTGRLRPQAVAAGAMTVVNLALSVVLVRRIGVAGPVVATCIAQLTCVVLPMGWYAHQELRRAASTTPPGAAVIDELLPALAT